MFGLFKSKKQRAMESMSMISKGMIKGTLEDNGIHIEGTDNVEDFCIQSSKAVGRIILNQLGIALGEGKEDDIFVAGAFVVGAGNYITHHMNENFEVISGAALVFFYDEEGVGNSEVLAGETIDAYNEMMTGGKSGEAMMGCIAMFFENSSEEHLEKLAKLYDLFRKRLSQN